MATTPTQNPVPSEAAVDLKFNAGKIDEFVTSFVLKYTDRLGRDHLTIEGMRDIIERAIKAFGFITMDSFEDGATLDNSSQVLRWENNGEYYRWDGSFPKVVPPTSTPETSGGIGAGVWLSVGDAALRSNLSSDVDGEGDALVAVKQPFAGSAARTQHERNAELLSPNEFSSSDNLISAMAESVNTVEVFNSDEAFTITVGPDGHYSNFIDAISGAVRMRPLWKSGNDFCEIKLKSGFVFSEQMEFKGGVDLSWIKITSEDAIVYSDTATFTNIVKTYYEYKYLFYFHHAAKSPVFAIQLEENRNNSDVVAFLVTAHSTLSFMPGSGARKFKGGVHASYGSDVIGLLTGISTAPTDGYYLCDFSDCITFAFSAMLNCRVHLPYSKFDNIAGEYAVFCIWSTVAEFRYSTANDCANGIGWLIRDGSVVSIRECQAKNCDVGIKGYHGVIINARCHDTLDDNGTIANPAVFAGVSGCNTGIYMDGGCTVEASSTDMRNCGTAIKLYRNCNVTAQSSCFDGCVMGFDLTTSSSVVCSRMSGLNMGIFCTLQNDCTVTTWNANVTGPAATQTRFIDIRLCSKVSIYNSTFKTNAGIMAENSSEFNFTTGILGALRLSSYFGSRASIEDVQWDFTYVVGGTPILNVQRGGIINAVAQRGTGGQALTSNVTPTTLTNAGIIFYQ